MTDQEILSVLTRILRDLLSNDDVMLRMETARDEVPNWDSFAYVNFVVAAEMEFGVRFGVAEVESFSDVGAIVRRIRELLAHRRQ